MPTYHVDPYADPLANIQHDQQRRAAEAEVNWGGTAEEVSARRDVYEGADGILDGNITVSPPSLTEDENRWVQEWYHGDSVGVAAEGNLMNAAGTVLQAHRAAKELGPRIVALLVHLHALEPGENPIGAIHRLVTASKRRP